MRNGSYAGVLLALAVGLTIHAPPLTAQTRFEWPDTTVDVGTYTTIDKCLAATRRIRDGIHLGAWSPVWRDTMPSDAQWSLEPLPALVTQAAQRCAARFGARTASLGDFALLMQLYLEAGRDTDANALLTRRLQEVRATHEAERAAVLDSVFHFYLNAQPVRLDAAEAVLQRRGGSAADRIARLTPYAWLTGAAFSAGDTARAHRVAQEFLALADSLTPAERNSRTFQPLKAVIYVYSFVANGHQLLDSLRHSTTAYARVMGLMWARFTGRLPETLPFIGKKAVPVVGDFWVPSQAAGRPRPTPGRVALVVFWDGSMSCFNSFQFTVNSGDLSGEQSDGGCFSDAAALHRLARRFPALQITIVTRTGRNVFGYLPPLSPTETADWLERAAAAFQLPGALAIVSQSPALRLPAPDNRIVEDSPDSNVVHYRFGDTNNTSQSLGAFLVDQHGTIVWNINSRIGFGVNRDIFSSTTWILMIDILLHRENTAAEPSSQ